MKRNILYRILVGVLALFMAMSVTSLTSFAAVWNGGISSVAPSRTSDGFYLLQNAEDLAWFAYQVNNDAGNVTIKGKLTADIYLNDVDNEDYSKLWTPIADYSSTSRVFSGVFDGAGFTIYGMNVNSDKDYQGLFGYLSGAQIKNVKLEKSFVNGVNCVGAIAGFSDNGTSIIYSSAKATVSGEKNVGGITGYLQTNGNITGCAFYGSVNAVSYRVGGITGCVYDSSTVSQCFNKGDIYSEGYYVGGIAGVNSGSTILSCYNTGNISGRKGVGGIAGSCVADIFNCYNAAEIVALEGEAGAIAGHIQYSKVNNCYYDVNKFTGTEDNAVPCVTEEMKRHSFISVINGSAGDYYYDYLNINDEYPILSWQVDQNIWDGTISEPEMSVEGDYYLITTPRELAWFAALVNGTLSDGRHNPAANAILTNSIVLNAGNLVEDSNVWTPIGTEDSEFNGKFYGSGYTVRGMYIPEGSKIGLFGQISADAIISDVTVAESYINGESYVGPIAGLSFGCIENTKVVYTEVNGNDAVGGIVGESWWEITDSSSIYSEITGVESVGGIVGVNNEGSVLEVCCSNNTVIGETYVGGIVGNNMADVNNTFNVGSVTASDGFAGGIAGVTENCTITDCYNTGEITGASYVGGIVGAVYSGSISSTYSIGKITGDDDANAVVGYNDGGLVENCYYDRNKVTDSEGKSVSDSIATKLSTEKMTGSDALESMSGLEEANWVALEDSAYFLYYPQLRVFEESGDYDLYEISYESVIYLKDELECKVVTNAETAYYATLQEAFDKIGTGTGVVELMDTVVVNETATVTGDVTVITSSEADKILRNSSMFDKPIVVKSGATLNFGSAEETSVQLTVDGNNVTDESGSAEIRFAESMVSVEEGGTVNFYNTNAINHTAFNGGFVTNNGTVNFYSGIVSDCVAIEGGGVAYNTGEKGQINVYATQFLNNNSKSYGGVFYNTGDGEIFVNTDSEFSNNTAGEGAVMYIDDGEVNMLGGSLYSNTATSYGGAFYVGDKGKLKLNDGSIYDNIATQSGSAVYTTGTVEFYSSGCIDLSNDVYLPKGEKITMSALSVYAAPIVKITPEVYTEGLNVVRGGYTAMNANLCSVTPDGETTWQINSAGNLTTAEIKTVLIASYFSADDVPYTSIEALIEDLDELEANLKEDDNNYNDQEIGKTPVVITLVDDIVVTEPIVIKHNTIIESDAISAHTISAAEGFEGPLFRVADGAVLTFGSSGSQYDSDVLYINGTNVTGDAVVDATGGSVRIYSGTVIFGANGIESAVKSANLIEMYDGKITENNVTKGAVYIVGGSFDFFGGTIFDNKNVGVYVDGTINIQDGASVDESNTVYMTEGNIINVFTPEPEVDEETGEEIPVTITMPSKIAHVDFEKYCVDTSIINTEESDDATKYAGKFSVVDTTYTLDDANILRADYFVLKDSASIQMYEDVYVYGFTLGVYTAESVSLQFENTNVAVIDENGSFKVGNELIGTGDSIVLVDKNNTPYRAVDILIYGDINADGCVNGEDALLVFMYVGGFLSADEFTSAQLEAMDVNHDGSVSQVDAEKIERMGLYEGSISQQMKQ